MNYIGRQFLPQYAAAIAASLLVLSTGMCLGWASPALQKLSSPNSTIPLTSSEVSWIISLCYLGSFPGPLIGALTANWLGRKPTILLTAIPFLISWSLIASATRVEYFYVSQLMAGISFSAALTVVPMYLNEIASPAIRGVLGMFNIIFMQIGIISQFATLPYMSIKSNAIMSLIIPVLLLSIFIWMPETPYYLQMKNKDESVLESLKMLRNRNDESALETELKLIRKTIEKQRQEKGTFLDLIVIPTNRRALIITIVAMSAQQLSGISAISPYAHLIFQASNSELSPGISGIIMEPLSFSAALPFLFLVDSAGRRGMLTASCFLTAIPLIALGIYFYLQSINYVYISSISIIPLISLFAYKFCFLIGLGSIPHILISEIFPTNVAVLASCVAEMFCAAVSIFMPKAYQWIEEAFGLYVVFWIFGGFCLMCAMLVWVLVPETKGKTFLEIQQIMQQKVN